MFWLTEWVDWKWIKGLGKSYIIEQSKKLSIVKIIEWINIKLLEERIKLVNRNNCSIKKFLRLN